MSKTVPPRPEIPPTLYVLGAVVGAEAAVLRLISPVDMRLTAAGVPMYLCLLCGLVVALCALFIRSRELRTHENLVSERASRSLVALIMCALLVGALVGCVFVSHGRSVSAALQASAVSQWHFDIVEDCRQTRYGWRCRAHAVGSHGESGDVWLTLAHPVDYGSRLSAIGRFVPNGNDEWGRSAQLQGVWGTLKVTHVVSSSVPGGLLGLAVFLRRRALAVMQPASSPARALLAACVCGYRTAMHAQGLDDLFSSCGVAHLVAVSGGHIAIIAAHIGRMGEHIGMRPRFRAVMILCLSGLFVLCCGLPVSALRSWCMSALAVGSRVVGRRSHALSSVCIVAVCMALLDPGVTGQLGYVLSVSSVIGLSLFANYADYALEALMPLSALRNRLFRGTVGRRIQLEQGIRSAIGSSLICQLVTLPFVLPVFMRLSLVAPLANALLTFPFTLFVALGALCVALAPLSPMLPHELMSGGPVACDVLAHLMLSLLQALASIPVSSVAVALTPEQSCALTIMAATVAVGFLLWWPSVKPQLVRRMVCLVALVGVSSWLRWRFFAPARIVVLDVDQGDAILVQDGAAALLVDMGPAGQLTTALARQHVFHLDSILLTHLHDDHTGGISDLVGHMPCEQAIVGEGVARCMSDDMACSLRQLIHTAPTELSYGDELKVGGWTLRMVWPREARSGKENGDSIELTVNYEAGDQRLVGLLTGDAERDETGAVLAAGDVGDIDFLKVGHHGSEISIRSEELTVLDPEVAVASAGKDNAYGHPSDACVDALAEAGAQFFCTRDVGDVTIEPGTEGSYISCQHVD